MQALQEIMVIIIRFLILLFFNIVVDKAYLVVLLIEASNPDVVPSLMQAFVDFLYR